MDIDVDHIENFYQPYVRGAFYQNLLYHNEEIAIIISMKNHRRRMRRLYWNLNSNHSAASQPILKNIHKPCAGRPTHDPSVPIRSQYEV